MNLVKLNFHFIKGEVGTQVGRESLGSQVPCCLCRTTLPFCRGALRSQETQSQDVKFNFIFQKEEEV